MSQLCRAIVFFSLVVLPKIVCTRENCALFDFSCHARNASELVTQVQKIPRALAVHIASELNNVATGMRYELIRLIREIHASGVTVTGGMIVQIRESINSLVQKNTYYGRPASVRFFDGKFSKCASESAYLENRMSSVKEKLEELLGTSFTGNRVPRVGVCCSGGGFRAACALGGALDELERQGLLDISLYIATLSGATWTVAPWALTEDSFSDFWVVFKQRLATAVLGLPASFTSDASGAVKTLFDIQLARLAPISSLVADVILKKMILNDVLTRNIGVELNFGGVFSMIDLYGVLLGASLFSLDQLRDYTSLNLASLVPHVEKGQKPLPVFTAVHPQNRICGVYDWYEYTPFEVASYRSAAAVPAWAWGRSFERGQSVGFSSPVSLGECLAIFGSAFSVTVEELYRHNFLPEGPLQDLLRAFIQKSTAITLDAARGLGVDTMVCTHRPPFGVSWENNFMFNLPGHLSNRRQIPFVDAGIDFGVPLVPLLYRDLDLIIVFDVAMGEDAHEFLANEAYARFHGLPFPRVDRSVSLSDPNRLRINEQIFSVFKPEEGERGPILVYIPLTKNDRYPAFNPRDIRQAGFINTFNLSYTPTQIDLLGGLYAQAVRDATPTIQQLLHELVAGG